MIRTQILQILQYNGLEQIPSDGEFKSDVHRAVDRTPCETQEEAGLIVKVVRPGFRTSLQILRYAEVVVAHYVPRQDPVPVVAETTTVSTDQASSISVEQQPSEEKE
jgi:hypothetical protein